MWVLVLVGVGGAGVAVGGVDLSGRCVGGMRAAGVCERMRWWSGLEASILYMWKST